MLVSSVCLLWVWYLTISGPDADVTMALDVMTGAPLNATVPVTIRQKSESDIRFDAAFRTRPFDPPIYWAVRISRRTPQSTWSLELMHDKLYADERPSDVDAFSISHGFNIFTLQFGRPGDVLDLRLGAGVVIAHPDVEVRGRRLSGKAGLFHRGYYVAGPAALVAGSRRIHVAGSLHGVGECRVSVAPVSVPVPDGDARFTHVGLHLLVGLSADLP